MMKRDLNYWLSKEEPPWGLREIIMAPANIQLEYIGLKKEWDDFLRQDIVLFAVEHALTGMEFPINFYSLGKIGHEECQKVSEEIMPGYFIWKDGGFCDLEVDKCQ